MTLGRPKKEYLPITHCIPIYNDENEIVKEIPIHIKCPKCGSEIISTNGTRKSGNSRQIIYQCKNPRCLPKTDTKRGKQFCVYTSFCFLKYTNDILKDLEIKIMHSSTTHTNIAKDYCLSPSTMTYMRRKFEEYVKKNIGFKKLLMIKEIEEAISIDETFFKIKGQQYYLIMATGYKSHRVLSLKVSNTRKEGDIAEIFNNAQNESVLNVSIVSADAWGATQSMILNRNQPMTFIIHKHKKPYDKAVIWRIEIIGGYKIITKVGIKTDFFKNRRKREFKVMQETIALQTPPKKKRGHPKGTKNKPKTKKPKLKIKAKKRGRKGIFKVFNIGVKHFARVDPYRNQILLSPAVPVSAGRALQDACNLYSRMHVQNNLSENKNNTIKTYTSFKGPKTPDSFENHIRSAVIYDNYHGNINAEINHRFQGKTMVKQLYHAKLQYFL